MKRILFLFALFAVCCVQLPAQSFKYVYKGIEFKCKVEDGKVVIRGFDQKADRVVIPAQVTDKRGRNYSVAKLDLFAEVAGYQTSTVAIEAGVEEIENYCFYQFRKLNEVYIPSSITRIGEKAFNANYMPTRFNMPSSISEKALQAGNVVYPYASAAAENPLASIDLSVYGDGQQADVAEQGEEAVPQTVSITPGTSDVDYNIPSTGNQRSNTFCVIIANEQYKQKDTPNVKYAAQDGKTFQFYCQKTLGLPKENIRFATNASYLQMKSMLQWFQQVAEVYGGEANFIVYYSGHGIPDEKGNCKLVPADVSINDVDNAFSLKDLYANLGQLTTNSVVLLVDACFSGNDRDNVAAVDEQHRGIVREVKNESVTGNVVVLTAASGTETALSYDEKAHGLFSYYLCKKLQDTRGNVTLGDLYDYVKREVSRKSTVVFGKPQTPHVSFSGSMGNKWRSLTF